MFKQCPSTEAPYKVSRGVCVCRKFLTMKCAFTPSVRVSEIALVKTLGRVRSRFNYVQREKIRAGKYESSSRRVLEAGKKKGLRKGS